METDIIIVSDHIEIHPSGDRYSVVRDGSVYTTCDSIDDARELADELALQEL